MDQPLAQLDTYFPHVQNKTLKESTALDILGSWPAPGRPHVAMQKKVATDLHGVGLCKGGCSQPEHKNRMTNVCGALTVGAAPSPSPVYLAWSLQQPL